MAVQQRILEPGEIASQSVTEPPFLRLPDRTSLFSDRARRLRQLADGHPMGDYLRFIAQVAETQQRMIDDMPPVMLPRPEAIELSREHGMPPLNALSHHRDRVWCDVLRRLLRQLAEETEGKLRETIVLLEGQRDEIYEAQASKLLANVPFGLDIAAAPLIGAALQVYWVHMVTILGKENFRRTDVPNVCPCCGSRPTASVGRIGAQESGYRYLHCSLCTAEWHMVRIKCTSCDSTKGIHYESIDDGRTGDKHAVKAECCDECGAYLKIMYMDRDNQLEATADDLATLALDLLVSETGKAGSGVNLMLIQGDAEE